MKRTIVSLAIATTMAAPVAFAGSDVQVYGQIDVSLDRDQEDDGTDKVKELSLNSNSSRLGVKAKTELMEGLTGIVKLEYELTGFDESSSAPFKTRDQFVGLTGNWGTFRVGNFDTPLKKAQGKVDMFNDRHGLDMKNYLSDSETRQDNSINYMLPDFSGFSGQITVAPGEDPSDTPETDADPKRDSIDHISASVYYKTKPLYLGVAYDNDIKNRNTFRLAASYKIASFMIGALVEQSELANVAAADKGVKDKSGTGYLVSASYTFASKHMVKIQGSLSDIKDKAAGDKGEHTMYAVGYDFKLADATTLYAQLGQVENANDNGTTTSDNTFQTFGLGMQHKF